MATDDLHYAPPQEGLEWVCSFRPDSVLVLGQLDESRVLAVEALALEARTAPAGLARQLVHQGTYVIGIAERWHVLIATEGKPPMQRVTGRLSRLDDDHHLSSARLAFEHEWDRARPFVGACAFSEGDVVRPLGSDARGRVKAVIRTPDGHSIEVESEGRLRTFNEDALRHVLGDPTNPDWWIDQKPANAEQIARTLTFTKLENPLTDTLYSFGASKTVFRPYQFLPALKVLKSATGRLLIADEVGLGKTIEAGLIWTELEQREPIRRALVVVPASLTVKWQQEMSRRFSRPLKLLTVKDLREFAEQLALGHEPDLVGIISLQALRGATDVQETLAPLKPAFQLVIVDEAHALRNRETKSYQLGELLSDWADYLIFLSATPLNLRSEDLFNLVNLLSEADFADISVFSQQIEPNAALNDVARMLGRPDGWDCASALERLKSIDGMSLGSIVTARPAYAQLVELLSKTTSLSHEDKSRARRRIAELNTLSGVLTRTRKADVPDKKAVREVQKVQVSWTEAERTFYDAVREWCRSRAKSQGVPPGFALQMPMRQAASSIPAMQAWLRDKTHGTPQLEVDDWDTERSPSDSGICEELTLQALLRPITVDTKFDALLDQLIAARNEGLGQVMIFSFFRRTLEYLQSRLAAHFKTRVMHGGTALTDRQKIMDDFRAGTFEVLLVSEVGSEGLDFEFCNVLVNYDMPWNPMRVEQRIGRLDRFGQQHDKILIYNMHVPGTIETDIFERLYQRLRLFESSIGELEPILFDEWGDALEDFTRRVLDPRLSDVQQRAQADRMLLAVENRRGDLQVLDDSRAILNSIEQLDVEGLTEQGPTDGRFVGAAELLGVVRRVLDQFGGRLTPETDGIWTLRGTQDLAVKLRTLPSAARGSAEEFGRLLAAVRDEVAWRITFESDVASKHDVDLISSRHPLVNLGMGVLRDESLNLDRFGAVRIAGIREGDYLVVVHLAETTGLSPRRELWTTSFDLHTKQEAAEVGAGLLTALAEGRLEESSLQADPAHVRVLYNLARQRVAERTTTVEAERRQENDALVEGRKASQLQSNSLKVRRARQVLDDLVAARRDARIIRMYEGRLKGLRNARDEIEAQALRGRELSVSLEPIAVVLVEGRSGQS